MLLQVLRRRFTEDLFGPFAVEDLLADLLEPEDVVLLGFSPVTCSTAFVNSAIPFDLFLDMPDGSALSKFCELSSHGFTPFSKTPGRPLRFLYSSAQSPKSSRSNATPVAPIGISIR